MQRIDIIGRVQLGPRRRVIIPFVASRICAGFPSPADDYLEAVIDLNELCIDQPTATYFARAKGLSMSGGVADIHEDDVLIVNRGKKPVNGRIVVACVQGEFTVKRLRMGMRGENAVAWLDSDNPDFPSLPVGEDEDVTIWGVVTWIFRRT